MPVMWNPATGVFGYVDLPSAVRMLQDSVERLDALKDHGEAYGGLGSADERAYQAQVADTWQLLRQIEAEQRMDEQQAVKYRHAADVLRDFCADDSDEAEEKVVTVSRDPRTDTYVVHGGRAPTMAYKSYADADREGLRRATAGRAG